MTVLFGHVLLVSLYITPVILLFLFLMPRISHRYTSRLRCFVWMLVAARLLVPVHYSLWNLFRNNSLVANLLVQINQYAVVDALQNALSDGGGTTGTVGQAAQSALINRSLLGSVWFVGMVLFLCGNLIAYRLTVKRLQRWSMPVNDPFLLNTFEETKKRLSVPGNIGLFHTSRASTPLLVGFIYPRIYLPNRQISTSEFSDVLCHELCHYKRKDLWFKLALLLSNAIHWFNPVVYFMLRQTELDIEMACDSDVLRGANQTIRKQYGHTILSFVEEAPSISTPLTTYFYGGKKQMKTRFYDIVSHNKKKTGLLVFLACALVVILCGAWSPNRSLVWPVPAYYTISTPYGWADNNYQSGIVISGKNIDGAFVIAAEGGTITKVNTDYTSDSGYGTYVIIDHGNGVSTLYAHLSDLITVEGASVQKGQVFARVGSSGFTTEPALHFELREDGNAVDPTGFLVRTKDDKFVVFSINSYIQKYGTADGYEFETGEIFRESH